MGSDWLNPPKDPKAALNSFVRPAELPLGSLVTVLISSPLYYSCLMPIYSLPPHPNKEYMRYVPPRVSICCRTDILHDLLICDFTFPWLPHTPPSHRKNKPPPSSIFSKVTGDDAETGQFSGSFQEQWEWKDFKRPKRET